MYTFINIKMVHIAGLYGLFAAIVFDVRPIIKEGRGPRYGIVRYRPRVMDLRVLAVLYIAE